ncbi:MAG: hypothetical protein NC416_05155 [Eubacterium sp.]|nr:hypothetical protein [Eubacterium sp.]
MKEVVKNKYNLWKHTHEYYAKFLNEILPANSGNEIAERKKHDMCYSYLLFDYGINVRKTLKQKRRLKTLFFLIIMGIFVVTFCCFFHASQTVAMSLEKSRDDQVNYQEIIALLTIIIPPLLALITAFIKIPEIIAKYLFNIKEDEYMASIIGNLQNYDKEIYLIDNKVEEQIGGRDLEGDDLANDMSGEETG